MNCPRCGAAKTNPSGHKPALGYRTLRCSDGKHRFNEGTGTPFNNLPFLTDIVLLVVLSRLRYKLSLRDPAALGLERGFEFTHETVRDWAARFAPRITQQLRATRKGKGGGSWPVGETYLRLAGRWHYLYRAIDREGNLVGSTTKRSNRHATSWASSR